MISGFITLVHAQATYCTQRWALVAVAQSLGVLLNRAAVIHGVHARIRIGRWYDSNTYVMRRTRSAIVLTHTTLGK